MTCGGAGGACGWRLNGRNALSAHAGANVIRRNSAMVGRCAGEISQCIVAAFELAPCWLDCGRCRAHHGWPASGPRIFRQYGHVGVGVLRRQCLRVCGQIQIGKQRNFHDVRKREGNVLGAFPLRCGRAGVFLIPWVLSGSALSAMPVAGLACRRSAKWEASPPGLPLSVMPLRSRRRPSRPL